MDGGVSGVVVRPGKRGRNQSWSLESWAQGDEAVEGAAGKGKAGESGPVHALRARRWMARSKEGWSGGARPEEEVDGVGLHEDS